MKIYIDGKYYDEKNAKISVFDHGLLYGDGIFEGIRAYHGRVFKLKEHIDRLFRSAKAILLEVPLRHAEVMKAEGFVAEGTGDNMLIVQGGELFTPPLSAGALYGITRGVVIDLARAAGVKVAEPNLTRYDLFNADECFLTGTGAELIPVVKIDGRVIGEGKPGPLTLKLVDKYRALTKSSGEPIYG